MKKEVENWLEQAEHDIEVAEYNLSGNMLDAAAFYSEDFLQSFTAKPAENTEESKLSITTTKIFKYKTLFKE